MQPASPVTKRRGVFFAVVLMVLVAGLVVGGLFREEALGPVTTVVAPARSEAPGFQEETGASARPPASDTAPGELTTWRREHSSLRGTELDGSWSLDAQGRLLPSLALRRRFDHVLLLRDGEASVATLTRLIEAEVQAAAGAAAAAQVLDLWQRYLVLLDLRFVTRVDLTRPETWGPALAERQRARRDHLGLAWAQAFYADEEAELLAMINTQAGSKALTTAALAPGVTVLSPGGPDRATLSAEQQERLDAVAAEQARWAERLAQARHEIEALRQAAHLSEPQRREAIHAWLTQHFDAREQLRVRGLLQLPN